MNHINPQHLKRSRQGTWLNIFSIKELFFLIALLTVLFISETQSYLLLSVLAEFVAS